MSIIYRVKREFCKALMKKQYDADLLDDVLYSMEVYVDDLFDIVREVNQKINDKAYEMMVEHIKNEIQVLPNHIKENQDYASRIEVFNKTLKELLPKFITVNSDKMSYHCKVIGSGGIRLRGESNNPIKENIVDLLEICEYVTPEKSQTHDGIEYTYYWRSPTEKMVMLLEKYKREVSNSDIIDIEGMFNE